MRIINNFTEAKWKGNKHRKTAMPLDKIVWSIKKIWHWHKKKQKLTKLINIGCQKHAGAFFSGDLKS